MFVWYVYNMFVCIYQWSVIVLWKTPESSCEQKPCKQQWGASYWIRHLSKNCPISCASSRARFLFSLWSGSVNCFRFHQFDPPDSVLTPWVSWELQPSTQTRSVKAASWEPLRSHTFTPVGGCRTLDKPNQLLIFRCWNVMPCKCHMSSHLHLDCIIQTYFGPKKAQSQSRWLMSCCWGFFSTLLVSVRASMSMSSDRQAVTSENTDDTDGVIPSVLPSATFIFGDVIDVAPNDPMPANHVPKLRLNESMLVRCSSRFCGPGPSCEKLRFWQGFQRFFWKMVWTVSK